ncbi:MAG: hypothetical protein RBT57_02920 [Paludibacter sp.]|jgi:trehalose-6-phosphatase|nr:hypothetical protein [Paludibacter sp.]
MKKKILAIDFDGTIVEDRYPEIGPLRPGAREVINRLHRSGRFKIIIWTCRTDEHAIEARRCLTRNMIFFDHFNKSCPQNVAEYGGVDTRKIYADMYIDDKGLHELPSWYEIEQLIEQRFK